MNIHTGLNIQSPQRNPIKGLKHCEGRFAREKTTSLLHLTAGKIKRILKKGLHMNLYALRIITFSREKENSHLIEEVST